LKIRYGASRLRLADQEQKEFIMPTSKTERHRHEHRTPEHHRVQHANWLRAAVLGANDGIVSTASLIIGVAAAGMDHEGIMIAGVAAAVAGAMSMAAGEYVSVSSQSDIEHADLERERAEIKAHGDREELELAAIYVQRGLDFALARQVAAQLSAHDALGAHARDELGISVNQKARPTVAAFASATAFTVGAGLPLLTALFAAPAQLIMLVSLMSLLFLGSLGAFAAYIGGAPIVRATARVMFWGVLAMAATAGIGALFGTIV